MSFSFAYRNVGTCLSDEKGEDTSGYTGDARGHKMTRVGETLRWCKRFKPKPYFFLRLCSINSQKGN